MSKSVKSFENLSSSLQPELALALVPEPVAV